MNILEYLCCYDDRNPNNIWDDDDEDKPKPRDNCACDSCYYGKDQLALEILKLRSVIEVLDDQVWLTYQDEMDAYEDHIKLGMKLIDLGREDLLPDDVKKRIYKMSTKNVEVL